MDNKNISRRQFLTHSAASGAALVIYSARPANAIWPWLLRLGYVIVTRVLPRVGRGALKLLRRPSTSLSLGISTTLGSTAKAKTKRNFVLFAELNLGLSDIYAVSQTLANDVRAYNADSIWVKDIEKHDPELRQRLPITIQTSGSVSGLAFIQIEIRDEKTKLIEDTLGGAIQFAPNDTIKLQFDIATQKISAGKKIVTAKIFSNPNTREASLYASAESPQRVLVAKLKEVQIYE